WASEKLLPSTNTSARRDSKSSRPDGVTGWQLGLERPARADESGGVKVRLGACFRKSLSWALFNHFRQNLELLFDDHTVAVPNGWWSGGYCSSQARSSIREYSPEANRSKSRRIPWISGN